MLVHGFTQTGRSWRPVADGLVERFEVVTVDAPGHGGSSDVAVDLGRGAELLATAGGRAIYVGYSMGGRLCLRLAVDRPDVVERLVLLSATAGIDDDDERAARRAADEELAGALEADGLDTFLERWVTQPLLSGPADPDLADRRRNTVAGLTASLRLAGTGTQEPLWDRLAELAMPVLLIAGSRDAKFIGLAERMAGAIPQATLRVIEGAGHTAHLEQPELFATVLTAWLVSG